MWLAVCFSFCVHAVDLICVFFGAAEARTDGEGGQGKRVEEECGMGACSVVSTLVLEAIDYRMPLGSR